MTVRNVGGTFVLTAATAAGLLAITPLAWTITLPLSVLLGALGTIAGIVLMGRPLSAETPTGRAVLIVVGILAELSAVSLAFLIGRNTRPAVHEYPYIVKAPGHDVSVIKAEPYETAPQKGYRAPGDTVTVDCYIDQPDGRWYRLSENEGWLDGHELTRAPYTGAGQPPTCPK